MKKQFVMTAALLCSPLVLMGCDSREKGTLTMEIKATDLKGNVQNIKRDCKHMQENCSKSFMIMTADGEQTVRVGNVNHPTRVTEKDARSQMEKLKIKEIEAGAVILSEYKQRIYVRGQNIQVPTITKTWKPGSTRTETIELKTDKGVKVGDIEVTIH